MQFIGVVVTVFAAAHVNNVNTKRTVMKLSALSNPLVNSHHINANTITYLLALRIS